jgi:DNA-nicking Smr family endonuclease
MSRERNETPRPRRPLSSEERKLWTGVTRSVAPLRRKPLLIGAPVAAPGDELTGPVRRRSDVPRPAPAPSAQKPAAKPTPVVAPLDRRQKRRLARGSEPIDARIDLHGRKLADAHAALFHFLRRAQADGARFALVITGKGSTPSGAADYHARERGALRRQVPLWLALPEFRAYVLAVEEAHAGHGGAGALYVRLRRPHR